MLKQILGTLKIGDKVIWRGGWGADPAVEVTISEIEICAIGAKNGRSVKSVAWNTVNRQVVVGFKENSHWAYGDQLDKIITA